MKSLVPYQFEQAAASIAKSDPDPNVRVMAQDVVRSFKGPGAVEAGAILDSEMEDVQAAQFQDANMGPTGALSALPSFQTTHNTNASLQTARRTPNAPQMVFTSGMSPGSDVTLPTGGAGFSFGTIPVSQANQVSMLFPSLSQTAPSAANSATPSSQGSGPTSGARRFRRRG